MRNPFDWLRLRRATLLEKEGSPVFNGIGLDPAKWVEEIIEYMKLGSPEGYRAAVEAGTAELYANAVSLWARALWNSTPQDDASAREEIRVAIYALAGRTFSEKRFDPGITPADLLRTEPAHLKRGYDRHVLSHSEFEELRRHYLAVGAAEKSAITNELIDIFVREPEFAKLLEHPIFANTMGDDELYLLGLGAYRYGNGNLVGAAMAFGRCAKNHPSERAFLLQGMACLANGSKDEAIAAFRQGIEQFADSVRLHIGLASAQFSAGETEVANETFGRVKLRYAEENAALLSPLAEFDRVVQDATAAGQHFPSTGDDVYTDDFAHSTWWTYWYHFNRYSRFQHGEGILDEVIPEYVGRFIDDNQIKPAQLIEVGTMCAEPLARLANRYPSCAFTGIDRQAVLKINNDLGYRLPNLDFVAGDVNDWLTKNADAVSHPSMLLHVRTAPFFYPAGLREMYERCAAAGVNYIALIEFYGFNHLKLRYETFDMMATQALARGRYLTHHNYADAFAATGYEIAHMEVLPPFQLTPTVGSTVFMVGKLKN